MNVGHREPYCGLLMEIALLSSFQMGGIGLMVCASFKTCPAHGWLLSTILNVGAGKEVGASHFNFEWDNEMEY